MANSTRLEAKQLAFEATKSAGTVSALLLKPQGASCLLIFAHGAGADMRNQFLESVSHELASRGIGTLRYQFPYSEKKSRRPDPQPILLATVRSAVAFAKDVSEGLPLFAGGKSMGGRMTSLAQSIEPPAEIKGIVFFGFPLHPAGAPSTAGAEHLSNVKVPMLFLQGTRDALADLSLLRPICNSLGDRATLVVVDEADHSFRVPKRTGRSAADIFAELAAAVADWSTRLPGTE
jgi:predicted alpha/beta-hydrolase family hydrolase